jgi:pyruvate dehydrogenase E1 component alpha subunit
MNKANLLKIFKNMLLIRILEEKISQKYNEQEMRCPVHLSIGQEAIATGICS